MLSYPPVPLGSRFSAALQALDQDDSLPFATTLPATLVEAIATQQGCAATAKPNQVYTRSVTLWAFLSQVLSNCKSCVAAVARVMVLRISLGLEPCSANTGAYCIARTKLPEPLLQALTYAVGDATEDQAPDVWRWHSRRVLLVDGTELTAPDTPENQAVYPQPESQKPGLGFPMMRLVVLLTFATASVIGAAFGPHQGKQTGETALLRQLLDRVRPGDVIVADRYHCSYWLFVALLLCGADGACRLHVRRRPDFQSGTRLGAGDHVIVWHKPRRPDWMDAATYAQFPDTLTIREVCFRVEQRGYRSKEIVVATTLLDDAVYTKEDIADLYHQRWHVELDIRAIKQTMRMAVLTCQTPAMLRRELWAHLLGYNLIRQVLAQAAQVKGLCPRQLSFAGAMQTWEAFRWLLMYCGEQREVAWRALLVAVGTHKVGNRPGRCEPRRRKRRPKNDGYLTKPRAEARAELLQE